MIDFKTYRFLRSLNEATYPGNLGLFEIIKFRNTAPAEKVKQFHQLIKDQKHKEAWTMVQDHLGIKLHPSAMGETE